MTSQEANDTSVKPNKELAKKLEEKERERQRIIALNKQASAGVLADLAQAGYPVEWVSDLFNKPMDYSAAIPILRHWLPKVDNLDVKEAIVRALSVRWAKPDAAPELISELEKLRDAPYHGIKWAIGNALSVVADDSVYQKIEELAREPVYGSARQMIAVALGNMKNPRAVDVLIELLQDEEVAGHILIALRKLKAEKARPHIERFLHHPKTWVRNEAKKALAKLGGK